MRTVSRTSGILMGRRGALLAALTLLCAASPAVARVESKEISLYAEVGTAKDFDVYGFKKGGHAEFNVEYRRRGTRGLEELHVYVFGCDELDMYIFRSQVQRTCAEHVGLENSTLSADCHVIEVGTQEYTQNIIRINRTERLTWAALLCGEGSATLKMDYTFMNPGGEHLGTEYIPLPRVYLFFLVIWTLLLCAQGYHGLVTHATTMTAMHKLMIVYPLLKILFEAAGMYRWQTMSDYGYVPGWVDLMHISVVSVNQGALFCILMLLSRGWLVTRRSLPPGERQTSVTMTILLIVMNMAYRYYEFNNMTFFGLAVTYMTVLAIILSSIARNIRELKMQLMILRQADIDPRSTPAHTKADMFRRFQMHMFSFICLKVFLEMVMLFLHKLPWIGHLFTETVDLGLCVSVGYAFRLRQPNPFNTEQGEFSWLPLDPTELVPRNGDAMQLVNRMAELGVQIDIPPATIYETEIQKATYPGSGPLRLRYDNSGREEIPISGQFMVVVENPPEMNGSELVESVSVAARVGEGCALSLAELHGVASTPERGNGANLEMVVISRDGNPGDLPGSPSVPWRPAR